MRKKQRKFIVEFRLSPQDFTGNDIPISPGIFHSALQLYQCDATKKRLVMAQLCIVVQLSKLFADKYKFIGGSLENVKIYVSCQIKSFPTTTKYYRLLQLCTVYYQDTSLEQAGAELCQAQATA